MSAPSTLRALPLPLPAIRSHEPLRRCSTAITPVLADGLATPRPSFTGVTVGITGAL